MKHQAPFYYGQYAGVPLSELPVSYLVNAIRYESPESPLGIFLRKLLEERTSTTIETGMHSSKALPLAAIDFGKRKLCPKENKRIFTSKKSALRRLRQIQNEPGSNHCRVPQRVHSCDVCGQWHLTSRKERDDNKGMSKRPGRSRRSD